MTSQPRSDRASGNQQASAPDRMMPMSVQQGRKQLWRDTPAVLDQGERPLVFKNRPRRGDMAPPFGRRRRADRTIIKLGWAQRRRLLTRQDTCSAYSGAGCDLSQHPRGGIGPEPCRPQGLQSARRRREGHDDQFPAARSSPTRATAHRPTSGGHSRRTHE
jgi:hypothetical protein